MPIIAEKVVYHLSKGDYVVPNRVRFYPYKVSFVNPHEFLKAANGAKPLITDIVRARNAEHARTLVRQKTTNFTPVFLTAGRYPEKLGTSVIGTKYITLSDRQLELLGAKSATVTPDPKKFASSNPTSSFHPNPKPVGDRKVWPYQPSRQQYQPPVPRADRATPIPLSSSSVLDVGGFTVGYKRPGAEPATRCGGVVWKEEPNQSSVSTKVHPTSSSPDWFSLTLDGSKVVPVKCGADDAGFVPMPTIAAKETETTTCVAPPPTPTDEEVWKAIVTTSRPNPSPGMLNADTIAGGSLANSPEYIPVFATNALPEDMKGTTVDDSSWHDCCLSHVEPAVPPTICSCCEVTKEDVGVITKRKLPWGWVLLAAALGALAVTVIELW